MKHKYKITSIIGALFIICGIAMLTNVAYTLIAVGLLIFVVELVVAMESENVRK